LSINACSASALSPVDDDWSLWGVVLVALFFPFRDWPGFTFGILSGRLMQSWLKECQNIAYLDVPEKYNLQMKHSTELLSVHALPKNTLVYDIHVHNVPLCACWHVFVKDNYLI
jgi:hypothetical protein